MSTVTNSPTTTGFERHSGTMFWRFVWKEFHMIRGLWLAVAIMGLLIQWAEGVLLPGSTIPLTLLNTVFASAVLYSVGAAATAFCVEHEEETYDFLARLPATWWPPFAAKLLTTLVSAILLVGVLSIPLLKYTPTRDEASQALGMLGFTIVEAIAWGTLLSLSIKRPLLAAIVTLFVGALVTTMAVNYSSSDSMASLNPQAYIRAIPYRIAIVAAIFVGCVLTARNWLARGARPAISTQALSGNRLAPYLAWPTKLLRADAAPAIGKFSRRRMLARLLWQTWRESWKLLLAPLGVAALLLAGMAAAIGLSRISNELVSFAEIASLLFTPALYGAMVFHSDQRRGNYRFLAEHAARPRFAWLARHIVWLGALVTLWLLAITALSILVSRSEEFDSRRMFQYYLEWGIHPHAANFVYDFATAAEIARRVITAGSFGMLIAYGIGQLLSMAIRSEILAAFLSLILSFVVGAWLAAVYLWQLSAAWFMLPLFAGLMLATWLRAPDWIAGRNSVRAWIKPVLAVITPIALIAVMLPEARLAHLRPLTSKNRAFADRLAALQAGDTTAAAQTADMYIAAATRLLTAPDKDPLAPWRKPEFTNFASDAARLGMINQDIVESKIPPDQHAAFKRAQEQLLRQRKERIAAAVNEAIEISKRPSCRFHFDPGSLEPGARHTARYDLAVVGDTPNRMKLDQLIGVVSGEPMSESDQPAKRFLAALQMGRHFREGQPSLVFIYELHRENIVLQRIARWALASGRTKTELRDLLDQLSAQFAVPESPADALLADHLLIQNVVDGKDPPFILRTTQREPHAYLAYLANSLSWERERARQALDRITLQNFYDTVELNKFLSTSNPTAPGAVQARHWTRGHWDNLPQLWEIEQPEAMTSYLVSLEYKSRVPVSDLYAACFDSEVCRRATLIQIALALYRLDHKAYPPQLADLVPDYLPRMPLDPYSRQAFHYEPNGVDEPLHYWNGEHSYEELTPRTPFIWSVGASDSKLKKMLSERADNDESQAPGEEPRPEKLVPRYEFFADDLGWSSGGQTLAFPLP